MTGYIVPCFSKRVINFGNSSTGGPKEVVLADRIDLLHWREATLQLKVHSHTLAGHLNVINIVAYGQSVSDEDPGVQFLCTEPGEAATIQLNAATPNPGYETVNLGEGGSLSSAPPMVRIVALFTQVDSGTSSATLSAEISVKDQ